MHRVSRELRLLQELLRRAQIPEWEFLNQVREEGFCGTCLEDMPPALVGHWVVQLDLYERRLALTKSKEVFP